MHRLRVTADKSAYDVVVGRGAWRALRRFPVARYSRVFVLTEQALWNRWGKQFLREGGIKRVRWVFLPPRLVLADPVVLTSLGDRAFRSGLYEVVKHAILDGPAFFHELEARLDSLRPSDPESLEPVLLKAVKVKVDVVSHDEREAGLRRVLNLGHTFGHALEEATGYPRFLHGEAVAA